MSTRLSSAGVDSNNRVLIDLDRLAEVCSSRAQGNALDDVDHWNDRELIPCCELGHFCQKSGGIVRLDHCKAALTIQTAEELNPVLIGRSLPLAKCSKECLAVIVVLLGRTIRSRLPGHVVFRHCSPPFRRVPSTGGQGDHVATKASVTLMVRHHRHGRKWHSPGVWGQVACPRRRLDWEGHRPADATRATVRCTPQTVNRSIFSIAGSE